MGIPFASLPAHLQAAARARLVVPAVVQTELGLPGIKEQKASLRAEIRDLHRPLLQWCALHSIPVIYSRPDRASTIKPGWPDISAMLRGKVAFVECKAPGCKLSARQEEVRAEIEAAGCPFLVCYFPQDGIEFLRERLGVS